MNAAWYIIGILSSNFITATVIMQRYWVVYLRDLASRTEFGNKRYDEGVRFGLEENWQKGYDHGWEVGHNCPNHQP